MGALVVFFFSVRHLRLHLLIPVRLEAQPGLCGTNTPSSSGHTEASQARSADRRSGRDFSSTLGRALSVVDCEFRRMSSVGLVSFFRCVRRPPENAPIVWSRSPQGIPHVVPKLLRLRAGHTEFTIGATGREGRRKTSVESNQMGAGGVRRLLSRTRCLVPVGKLDGMLTSYQTTAAGWLATVPRVHFYTHPYSFRTPCTRKMQTRS
mmetsp:Transcript_44215/g.65581  ORF Transcript_44215/g.65581 Transcript_44215/m.65581 type:complete len:207 (-) Transcript_44215:65-685(-)